MYLAGNILDLATASVAANVAYLALERFRYRYRINKITDDMEKIFEKTEYSRNEMNSLKNVQLPLKWTHVHKMLKNRRSEERSLFYHCYKILFSMEFDRAVGFVFLLFSGIVLILMTYDSLVLEGDKILNANWVWVFFYILCVSLAFPIACVVLGRMCVKAAKNDTNELHHAFASEQLKVAKKKVADASRDPDASL